MGEEKRRRVLSLDDLSLDDLSDPMYKVRSGSLYHMGRALTQEIVEFINVKLPAIEVAEDEFCYLDSNEEVPIEEARAVEEIGFYGFRYITGPPGTGKSTSLQMAVKYLSALYKSERPVRRKIVFVDGTNLVKDPQLALSSALRKADTIIPPEGVFDSLTTSELRYTIVVDDGNKVPVSSRAAIFLASLISPGRKRCVVVFCASVSSEWALEIRKPKTHHCKTVTKGLEGEELDEFCKFYRIDKEAVDMHRTGTNPRLLLDFNAGTEVIEKTVSGLEVEATEYLTKAVSNKRDRDALVTVMTETTTSLWLDPIQGSKCFYVTEDGSLDCITDELRSFCKAKVTELISEAELSEQSKLIAVLTHAISHDNNTSRIGWNAEEAVLLALKFLNLNVPYAEDASFETGAPAVELFKGQMSADKLCGNACKSVPRVYVPKSFTHKGLDFYLELEDTLVAFQVSVAENAESRHHLTVETAEELFQAAGKRVNILIYVIPCEFSSERVSSVKYTDLRYFYVKMSFGGLSGTLRVIDERLKQIRGSSQLDEEDKCWKCGKQAGDTLWVACDVCHLWYHQSCVGYDPTPEPAVLRRRPCHLRQLPAPSPPLVTREFECEGCKDYVKRKNWQSMANEYRCSKARLSKRD